jgi:hypothetical protein
MRNKFYVTDNIYNTELLRGEGGSSVGTATGYGLDDQMIGARFLAGAGNFPRRHSVQTGSGAHPASNPKPTEGFIPGGKAAEE